MEQARYFVLWFRHRQQNGYMLWIEKPEAETLWTDNSQRAVVFRSERQVVELARQLAIVLEPGSPQLIDLDVVANWLDHPEKMPPPESLAAWSLFDDLGCSVRKLFTGNVKAPVRNRVFELLYATAKVWRTPLPIVWPRQERNVLRRILRQGFRLWNKYVYWPE